MAYAAVASLLQTIEILLDHHQHSISLEFEDQIKSIHQHTCSLQSFMEDSSARVNNWEETFREVTVRAEDIIELLLSDSLLGSSRSGELEKGECEVHYSFDELEKVKEEMESIVNRVMGRRRVETGNGSDEELMEMISRLVGGSSFLEIIAICGSSGIGKSYLAEKAYFHPLIAGCFDVRLRSTVTREGTLVRMIRVFLQLMNACFSISNSEDELIQIFLQNLGRKRYLIVVDDLWSKDFMERLKMVFPDCGNGSRIIVTTQLSELAQTAHHVHQMRLLDDDESWNMIRDTIFEGDPCPFQLESIGKTIARCCGGHQLSIAVVSGILAADQSEAAWEDVLENIKLASGKVDEIVYLSYVYLPHHLRPCLLYLGIYRQGLSLYVSTLVRMWVAEGFVNESEYKSLEETCEGYVEDLVKRRLVSVYAWNCNGRIKSITVHDLVRGMCQRQARIDNFSHHFSSIWSSKEIIKSSRRVSIFNNCDDFRSGVYGSTIRTLCFYSEDNTKLDLRWIRNVRLLRVLILMGWSSEVFELFHLRFLALYLPPNIPEPEAISNLQNLQTLIIRHEKVGGVFDKLPEGIWRMPQLRHLYVYSFKFPNEKRPSSPLQNLHTLSRTVDFVCSREILKMFPNVKKLDLLYTKNRKGVVEDYELHNLMYLHKLEVLKLHTNLSIKEEHKISCAFPLTLKKLVLKLRTNLSIREEHKISCAFPLTLKKLVLKLRTNLSVGKEHRMSCATFPPTLKKLSLRGQQLSWKDMKMVASLPNLEVLKLRNHACIGETWETSDGGFSQLLFLRIEESDLEKWITKSSHFPRLWRLVLVRCSSLLEVPYEMAGIPKLRGIFLDDTNQSLWRSAQRIQEDRHSLGHDPLRVGVV